MRTKNNNQKGGFLIELMIGLLLSTLTVMAVITIYSQFEIQKRTTVQLGETMANAGVAMFPIQHNAKMAGYGIVDPNILGCAVKAYNGNTNTDFTFSLTPVLIEPGATPLTSDKVTFTYGSSELTMLPVKLVANSNAHNANIKVENKAGFNPGDLVILSEPGKNCNLVQVSGVQGNSDVVLRNTGNYTDPVTGNHMDITYNKAGGLTGGESYTSNAVAMNIGAVPQMIQYSIQNNQLIETNGLTMNSKVVMDNVFLLKVRYGLDLNNDGSVETWTTDIGPSSNYMFLKAVKIAIVARAPLIEQKINGQCKATTNSIFNWDNETIDINGISANWDCYRYRFIQTIVPLRNMIWSLG